MYDIGTLVLLDTANGSRLGTYPATGGAVFFGRAIACQVTLPAASHRVCGAFVPLPSGWELVNNSTYGSNIKEALALRTQDDRVRVELRPGAHITLPDRLGRVAVRTRAARIELLWRLDGFASPPLVAKVDRLTEQLLGTPTSRGHDTTPALTLSHKELVTLVAMCSEVLAGRSRRFLSWVEVVAAVGEGTPDQHRKRMVHLVSRWRTNDAVAPEEDLYDVADRILQSGRLQAYFEDGGWRADGGRTDGGNR